MNMTNHACRICRDPGPHAHYLGRERMFGWRDEFPYFQCRACGCLQIVSIPADLARYYPPNYYSFHQPPTKMHGWKPQLAAWRDRSAATGGGWVEKLLARSRPTPPEVKCLGRIPLRLDMHILDVGCGDGRLLTVLHRAGFRHLLGVDPFLAADREPVPGVRVRKAEVETVPEKFDLVMLHHVFEHVPDGGRMLAACRERLRPGGRILLRLPTAESDAWERYRTDWVQMDAPRHICLHTRRSLRCLAAAAGLQILETWCDASAFQFVGSEWYRQGGALVDASGKYLDVASQFPPEQIAGFAAEAVRLNAAGRGDQMGVLLGAVPTPASL